MCRKAKEKWMEVLCDELETLERNHAHRAMHQKIKNVTKLKESFTTGGGMMDEDGNMLYETRDLK